MQHAAAVPAVPIRRSIVASLVALAAGAAVAVGGYALIDDQDSAQLTEKVVFIETAGPGEGVRGIEDTANTAPTDAKPAPVPYLSHGQRVQTAP